MIKIQKIKVPLISGKPPKSPASHLQARKPEAISYHTNHESSFTLYAFRIAFVDLDLDMASWIKIWEDDGSHVAKEGDSASTEYTPGAGCSSSNLEPVSGDYPTGPTCIGQTTE